MSFNILFMGTPHFAKEFLKHVCSSKEYNIKAVYTQPPKKSHRGQKINLSPVHEFAKKNKINVFCPTKFSTEDILNIKKINPDVILVVAYGVILPKEVLKIPCCGAVNVHASLLPKWRGAAPIQRAIMNGDKLTGISIMKMVEKLDEGPTYLQSEIQINENDTYDKIYNNLIDVGKETLDYYFSGHQPYLPVDQNDELASYANKITKKDMQINFDETAFTAHKKICAFSPKPGAWFILDSCKYKIYETKFIKNENFKKYDKSENLILSFKKDYLLIKKIQKEGKNIMSIEDFGRGYSKELKEIKEKFGAKR